MSRFLLLFYLFPALCWGQVSVTATPRSALVGFTEVSVFEASSGPYVFYTGEFLSKNVAVIDVVLDFPPSLGLIIDVLVEDVDRNQVVPDKLGEFQWVITVPGRHWVDVTVIDFQQLVYSRKRLVVDIAANPPTGPPNPDNPNPDNPDPDNPNPDNPDPDNPDPGGPPEASKWEQWVIDNPPPLEFRDKFPQIAQNFRDVAGLTHTDPLILSSDLRQRNRSVLGPSYIKFLDFSYALQQALNSEGIKTVPEMQQVLLELAKGLERL